jgi:Pex2 / Pex12 amino terminal region
MRASTAAIPVGGAGLGQQTLGEEYCDLLQVNSSRLEPAPASRALVVLLHAALPIIRSHLQALEDAEDTEKQTIPDHAPLPPAAPADTSGYTQGTQTKAAFPYSIADAFPDVFPSPNPITSAFNSAQDLAEVLMSDITPVPADTLATPPHSHVGNAALSPSGTSTPERGNGTPYEERHWSSHTASAPPSSPQRRVAAGDSRQAAAAGISRLWRVVWGALVVGPTMRVVSVWRRLWVSPWLVQAARWLPAAMQLHLAMFYIFGLYYELPKRLTGTQYIYVGASQGSRRYFGAMGLLLVVQVLLRVGNMCRCARLGLSCAANCLPLLDILVTHNASESFTEGSVFAAPNPRRLSGQMPATWWSIP